MIHGSCSIYKSGKLVHVSDKIFSFKKFQLSHYYLQLQQCTMDVHVDNVHVHTFIDKTFHQKGKCKSNIYNIKSNFLCSVWTSSYWGHNDSRSPQVLQLWQMLGESEIIPSKHII